MKRLATAAIALCMVTTSPAQTPPTQRLFYSGHSLLDEPLPQDVARIAASLGQPLRWSRHHLAGSSIGQRNQQMPQALQDGPYDTLIVTEQHTLIGNLVWNDSVRQLRRLHDRFIDGNARGQTWFYASWLNLDTRDDPRRWIAHERAATPLWQCITTRINLSLTAEKRSDLIAFLPAGALLAALVERATQGGGIAGLGTASPRAAIDRLFRDDVHLTPLGSYFMSLVVYATLFDRSPTGAAIPDGIDTDAARALQAVAWDLVRAERLQQQTIPLDACRDRLQDFVGPHASYLRDAVDRPSMGAWRAWLQWAKHRVQWHWALRSGPSSNPMYFDPADDRR